MPSSLFACVSFPWEMNFITDVDSEPLSMSSGCHSFHDPSNWVDNSRRIRKYWTRVFYLDLSDFPLVNMHVYELPRCSNF